MAYSERTKAEAASDVLTGRRSRAQVMRDLKCSSSTLDSWIKQAKKLIAEHQAKPNENRTTVEPETEQNRTKNRTKTERLLDRIEDDIDGEEDEQVDTDYTPLVVSGPPSKVAFEESLYGFLMEANEMGRNIARTCSDPKFIRKKPSAVNELARTVFEQRDRVVSFVHAATSKDSAGSDDSVSGPGPGG